MPSATLAWPALRTLNANGGVLRPLRAVWGKMHRASTDSRWIAVTNGFDPSAELGIRALTVSTEDEPRTVYAWKPQGTGFMAVHGYPSRARDAAGRSGGLEKQILFVRADASLAATLAAFFLIEGVSHLDDAVWWDSWSDPNWEDYRHRLLLPPEPEVAWSSSALESRIERGLEDVRNRFSPAALASLYQAILDGRAPGFLRVDDDPISPAGLAALLLPLEPDLAERQCLLSGLPDGQLAPDRLQAWSGVISRFQGPAVAAGQTARRMADCLLNGDPTPLKPVVSQPAVKSEQRDRAAERLKEFLDSDSRALCGPELALSDWRVIQSESESAGLAARIRRLDADLETDGAFPNDAERRQARLEHLRVKYDQARSWLYAFAPGSKTLEILPPRPGSPVAALRFAHLLVPDDWPHLLRYSEGDWARLVAYSLKQGQFEKRTLDWLVRFVPTAPPAVQALLQPYMRL